MLRKLDLVILSDIHLGTFGCRAKELLNYLHSIQPKTLILNGDIIDMWQFKKSYFPQSHLKVLKKIIDMASDGTQIIYITGNHDETLRRFTDLKLGQFTLTDKKVLEFSDGKKAWVFHGDVFDASIQHSKWIAKLGGFGYDLLIMLNNLINYILVKMGRERFSLSKKIKNSVKEAVKYISDFEQTASDLAIQNQYDFVVCGHIHQPQIKQVSNKKGSCIYLNSGDWIENLSALEYHNNQWDIFLYEDHQHQLNQTTGSHSFPPLSIEELIQKVTALA